MPVGITTAVTGILGSVGVGAATADVIAGIAGPALLGAGVGAGISGIEGKSLGKGALLGGLTGGALGFGPAVGAELGIGTTAADAILGAGAGAIGQGLTGGNIGKGALFGGAEGLAAGLLTGAQSPGATAPSSSAPSVGGASGGGQAAATAVGTGGIPDLTAAGAGSIGGGVTVSDLGAPAAGGLGGGIPGISVTGTSLAGTGAGSAAAPAAFGGAAAGGLGSGVSVTDVPALPGTDGSLSKPLGGTELGGGNGALGGGGAAPAAGGSSISKFLSDPSLKTAGSVVAANPAATVGALGLGYQALTQPKLPSQAGLTGDLKNTADHLSSQGAGLESYINSGTLPPGALSAINNASASAKATLKSKYAAMGLSGSTSEATALAGIDQQVQAQIFEQANSLLQTGIKESGLSADIYKALLGETNQQNQEMTSAIANFAAAIAGGGNHGITLNLGDKAA